MISTPFILTPLVSFSFFVAETATNNVSDPDKVTSLTVQGHKGYPAEFMVSYSYEL